MVNDPSPTAAEAETALVLGYAPAEARAAVAALWALDGRLGDLVRAARDPLVGQMRLTWWHEALTALDTRPAPAEPILRALADQVVTRGVRGSELAAMIEGREVLLDEPAPGASSLARYAEGRGGTLFSLAGRLLGAEDPRVPSIGEGWALADLARHLSNTGAAASAAALAGERLGAVGGGRWSRPLRPLAAAALLARSDLAGGEPGSPARVGRLLILRLTGR